MPTPPEQSATIALLFDFDGTLYVGDLPILAYARHCAEQLDDDGAAALIDHLRYFLEGKSIGERTVDLSSAEDGFQAVEILGAALGLSSAHIAVAYQAAREDLAASAFALDAPDGLLEMLRAMPDAHVMVVTNADPIGVREVLDAIEVAGFVQQVLTDAGKPASMPGIVAATLDRINARDRPERMMVVGDRWATDLADAHRLGATTALIDRFHRGDGSPTYRAADLSGLLPDIRDWAKYQRNAR